MLIEDTPLQGRRALEQDKMSENRAKAQSGRQIHMITRSLENADICHELWISAVISRLWTSSDDLMELI